MENFKHKGYHYEIDLILNDTIASLIIKLDIKTQFKRTGVSASRTGLQTSNCNVWKKFKNPTDANIFSAYNMKP